MNNVCESLCVSLVTSWLLKYKPRKKIVHKEFLIVHFFPSDI